MVVGSQLLLLGGRYWSRTVCKAQFFNFLGGGGKWFTKQGLQEHFVCSPQEKQQDKEFTSKFSSVWPPGNLFNLIFQDGADRMSSDWWNYSPQWWPAREVVN